MLCCLLSNYRNQVTPLHFLLCQRLCFIIVPDLELVDAGMLINRLLDYGYRDILWQWEMTHSETHGTKPTLLNTSQCFRTIHVDKYRLSKYRSHYPHIHCDKCMFQQYTLLTHCVERILTVQHFTFNLVVPCSFLKFHIKLCQYMSITIYLYLTKFNVCFETYWKQPIAKITLIPCGTNRQHSWI